MAVNETDAWAGRELAARRAKKDLTQEELAAKAGIDRSRLVGLENGRQRISPYYAEKLAPHLGLKDHRKLLPPREQPDEPENPLARLAKLEGSVAEVARVQALLLDELALVVDDQGRLASRPSHDQDPARPKKGAR